MEVLWTPLEVGTWRLICSQWRQRQPESNLPFSLCPYEDSLIPKITFSSRPLGKCYVNTLPSTLASLPRFYSTNFRECGSLPLPSSLSGPLPRDSPYTTLGALWTCSFQFWCSSISCSSCLYIYIFISCSSSLLGHFSPLPLHPHSFVIPPPRLLLFFLLSHIYSGF